MGLESNPLVLKAIFSCKYILFVGYSDILIYRKVACMWGCVCVLSSSEGTQKIGTLQWELSCEAAFEMCLQGPQVLA